MGKIILVRHGETELNREKKFFGWQDPELNSKGINQAENAGKNLKEILKKISDEEIEFFSSPLKRAVQTAEAINSRSWDINFDESLKELNFGIFEGLSYEEIIEKYPKQSEIAFEKWQEYNFETGESPQDLQRRTVTFLEEKINLEKTTIIVAHWGVINCILSHLFSRELDSYWKFSLKNGGIAVIGFDNSFPVLEGFNIGAWNE